MFTRRVGGPRVCARASGLYKGRALVVCCAQWSFVCRLGTPSYRAGIEAGNGRGVLARGLTTLASSRHVCPFAKTVVYRPNGPPTISGRLKNMRNPPFSRTPER
ncbi:unnamed protein product [Protopolystoma xenopodis]|uniref:Uncharacterized protein n=1 Tax=Protopolystoma xenopodis TaxID=117903 RepID=A0A3S5BV90_9PLAT|nr:unnamed protein product [Protopolystoma xenopodis]